MSSFLYAQIAQQRKTAAASAATARASRKSVTEDSGDPPPVKPGTVSSYVEALAALIPAEVLTLHALILSATTEIIPTKDIGDAARVAITGQMDAATPSPNTITVISDGNTLQIAFWILALISLGLYLVPRLYAAFAAAKAANTRWQAQMGAADWARAAIPPLAFTGWTMLQRATAFDAACPHLTESQRTVFGLLLAAVLIASASWLAYKPSPPSNG